MKTYTNGQKMSTKALDQSSEMRRSVLRFKCSWPVATLRNAISSVLCWMTACIRYSVVIGRILAASGTRDTPVRWSTSPKNCCDPTSFSLHLLRLQSSPSATWSTVLSTCITFHASRRRRKLTAFIFCVSMT